MICGKMWSSSGRAATSSRKTASPRRQPTTLGMDTVGIHVGFDLRNFPNHLRAFVRAAGERFL